MNRLRYASDCSIIMSLFVVVILHYYFQQFGEAELSTSKLSSLPHSGRNEIEPRIAVGIQGPADYLDRWQDVFSYMSTRSEVDFFCLVYEGNVNETMVDIWRQEPSSPLKRIMYNSTTTWTTGRNLLAQAIYAEEVKRSRQYKSWVFSDADAWVITCAQCPAGDRGAACCWDYMFRDVLLSNYSFATVATLSVASQLITDLSEDTVLDITFNFQDCADAQVQAFHRDAVPVLLPYHADLESLSWWSSQAMLFKYTSGCLPDANVALGRAFHGQSESHKSYPRGRDYAKEHATVVSLFPSIAGLLSRPGMCEEQTVNKIRTINPLKPQLVDWQSSDAFLKCLAAKEPYFIKEIGMNIQPAPK